MANKEDILDRIDTLSDEVRQTQSEAKELFSAYQSLAYGAATVRESTDATLGGLEALADAIGSGEIEMSEDVERAVQRLYNAGGDVSDVTHSLQAFREDADKTKSTLFDYVTALSGVINLARDVQ